MKIALKGVVQLFNAIKQQQSTINKEICKPGITEGKKEKILMLSLQRRQQQEEMKARKEMEAARRREIEKMKEEDKARKKEEEKARRAAILEQYKLKKAIEEAEREVGCHA